MSRKGRNRTPDERQADYRKGEVKQEQQKAVWIARTLKGMKRDAERREREQAKRSSLLRTEESRGNSTAPVGRVLTRARSGILVQADDQSLHWCRLPGKGSLLKAPVPGDQVQFTPSADTSDGWILGIEPRNSLFHRYVFGRVKEIAANMDQILILATPHSPIVSPRLVDRMIIGAELGGLEPIVLINKLDLFTPDEITAYSARWERAGYPVLRVCAETGEGFHLLRVELEGRTTLLAGASGVGKSTLLNRLIEDLDLDTAAVSEATGRGVHTTTATRLYPVPGGGVIADTPGVREFYPVLEEPRELHLHFPEFADPAQSCQFDDCLHLEDSEGCGVREAVEAGKIDPDRYTSYLLIYETLLIGPSRGRALTQG